MKNINELKSVVKRIDAGEINCVLGAKISGYSYNHVKNMVAKYKKLGDSAFIHGNTGKTPAVKTDYNIRRKVVSIYKNECSNVNFTAYTDLLDEFYDIHLTSRTVYNILTAEGIDSPEKRKVKKTEKVRRVRPRRECEGDLLQVDATPFDWFGDGNQYALHGAIDDATGKWTGLYLCQNECLYGYLELIRQTFFITGGGHPCSIYSDRASIFCYAPRDQDKLTVQEQLAGYHERRTQWQRVLSEVHVEQILAFSPQAKGRVERQWRTVQGTLPWRLQHLGIKDIATANQYLIHEYLPWFNKKYSVPAANPVKVWHKSYLDPEYVLCARHPRRTNSAGVFSFEGYKWLLDKKRAGNIDFELCINERGIKAYKDGEFYPVKLLEDIQEELRDRTPEVLKNIIFKYMYEDGHTKR